MWRHTLSRVALAACVAALLLLTSASPAPAALGFVAKWGAYGSGDGQFSAPWGIATDSSDNVYVTDFGNNRIEKFSSSGSFITKWGTYGSGAGQFNQPSGIATDYFGNVYVADHGNNRIEKFSSSGSFLAEWGSYGPEEGQFFGPNGIATDSSDNVYVADTYAAGEHVIKKFSSSGSFIAGWGGFDGEGELFNAPVGIATDSSDNVYVADTGNYRIEKFSSTGTLITKWRTYGYGSGDDQPSGPVGIATDSFGNVYVDDGSIKKFSSSGSFIAEWGAYGGAGEGQLNHPIGVATDSSGNVYVADFGNDRIEKLSSTPETTITGGLTKGSTIPEDKTLTFEFNSDEAGSTFVCKLDDGTFASCVSPLTLTPVADASASRVSQSASASRVYQGGSQPVDLQPGPHTFQVRATNPANHVDPTPATLKFLTSSCRPGFLGFRVVASILTGWPDPQSTQCWKWDRISGKSPKPHDYCNDDSKRQGAVHLWAYNDTNLKNNPSVDVRGVKWCYQHFSKGLGNILMAYSPPGTSDYRGRRVNGWAFTGHEPVLKNRPAHFMQMYSKQNLANAPHDQWFSRRRTYKAMINVGAVGANGKELKPATLESTLLKYCRESKGVGALGVGTLGVYAGSKEVHSLARARLVYRTLDKCTGGSHLGP